MRSLSIPLTMWQKIKHQLWEWRGVWITTPTVTALVMVLRLLGGLQTWEWAAFDQYMRLRPSEAQDSRIVIVGINEADIQEIGQAIIPDRIYAQLIENLRNRQPRAIGLDIYRDRPVEPGHQQLVKIFETTPNLVGIQKVVGEKDQDIIPPPPQLALAGANDLIFDADKIVRRSFLTLPNSQGQSIPSFSVYLAGLYLEKENISPEIVPGTNNWWKFNQTVFVPFQANDGGYVRADAGGYQILLNYRGGRESFDTVSLTDVLKNRVPPDWGKDKIILIGAVGESFGDLFFTPYTLTPATRISGVEIHANFTSQILSSALDHRPLIKTWAESYEILWILSWAGIGAILTWKWRYLGGVKTFAWQRLVGWITIVGILGGSTLIAFWGGWWIPVIPAMLAFGGSAIAITGYLARTAGDIRKTFGRYLSDEIVANLLENPEGLKLGGQRREITILTSDLRGFTTLSERLNPEEVVKILNYYLHHMAEIITAHLGTIDEFMGDGILVLFGAPTKRADDPHRAVACAVAMQQAMIGINTQMEAWGLPPLEMGIGINTGVVVVGNIGSEKRTKYGVVGSQVNLTYRIESYTTGGQILISESTRQAVGDILKIETQKQVQPKGVKTPITIYEIGGIGGKYNCYLQQEEESFFAIPGSVSLRYVLLDGKHIGEEYCQAEMIKLSEKGALIRLKNIESDQPPPAFSNLKLNFLGLGAEIEKEDVYAKVLENTSEAGTFYIRFANKPRSLMTQLLCSPQDIHQSQEN